MSKKKLEKEILKGHIDEPRNIQTKPSISLPKKRKSFSKDEENEDEKHIEGIQDIQSEELYSPKRKERKLEETKTPLTEYVNFNDTVKEFYDSVFKQITLRQFQSYFPVSVRDSPNVIQLYSQFVVRQTNLRKKSESSLKAFLTDYQNKYPFSFQEAMIYLKNKEEALSEEEGQLQNEIKQLKSNLGE